MQIGTLTRQANSLLNDLENEFNNLYYEGSFEKKIYELEKAFGKSNYPSLLADLYHMLDCCNIKYEKNKKLSYYKDLIQRSDLLDINGLEKKMLQALFNKYKEYPSPEKYMERIVRRLSTDNWEKDTLRVRILKQFIKYGNYLKDAGVHGETFIKKYVANKSTASKNIEDILNSIEDDIFLCLNTATKEQKKNDGKFGLLKISDDLAQGKFRSFGSTKKSLYYFAIVYNMTFSLESSAEIDYLKDIEKNLFVDYYSNNLMRFISEDYKNNKCEFEIDPSGQGINFNNFAEMVYLYYLIQDVSPQEKIKAAEAMIREIKSTGFKKAFMQKSRNEKSKLLLQNVFSKNEIEFKEFILSNYDCNTYSYETKAQIGVMQLGNNQESAFECYKDIVDMLLYQMEHNHSKSYDCGLWFPTEDLLNQCADEIDEDFKELIKSVSKFVGNANDILKYDSKSKKVLFACNTETVTRTSILVSYYYYYMFLCDMGYGNHFTSFRSLYNDFKSGVDEYLTESSYQPFSSKNIFDVLLVFAIYDSIL